MWPVICAAPKNTCARLCQSLGIKPGETTADGMVTIEEVKCLAACDRAPLFQSQIGDEMEYHENQTPEKTLDWIKSMKPPQPGTKPKRRRQP